MRPPRLATVADYLEHYAATTPDVPLVVHGRRRLTYGDAIPAVQRLGCALLRAGVRHGDRIAVYSRPDADCLLVFLAAAHIGAIFVGLNPKHREAELTHVVLDATPSLLFCFDAADEDVAKLEAVRARVGQPLEVLARDTAPMPPGWNSFTAFADSRVDQDRLGRARAVIGPADPVAMVYTSGSSGAPKGALLVNGPMMRAYALQAEHWYDAPPIGVADLPVNHLGFVGDNCMTLMVAGGTIHILARWTPEAILSLIERERLTFWWTQTTMLLLATRSERWHVTDFSSLYRIAFGGAPASEAMLRALMATGVPLSTGYGMTEVHGNLSYAEPSAEFEVLLNTVGRPHPALDVRIADERGRPCSIGVEGEIQIRGETLFGGYRHRTGAVDPARDADGWYHTQDMAYERPDGNLVLVGRTDSMFKSGGYNVYPREIERVLEQHPGVSSAAVVSVEDPTWARVGYAFVLCADGVQVEEAGLREYLQRHLANYKVPKRFAIRSELPMLPSGKVDVAALRLEARRPPLQA